MGCDLSMGRGTSGVLLDVEAIATPRRVSEAYVQNGKDAITWVRYDPVVRPNPGQSPQRALGTSTGMMASHR